MYLYLCVYTQNFSSQRGTYILILKIKMYVLILNKVRSHTRYRSMVSYSIKKYGLIPENMCVRAQFSKIIRVYGYNTQL